MKMYEKLYEQVTLPAYGQTDVYLEGASDGPTIMRCPEFARHLPAIISSLA